MEILDSREGEMEGEREERGGADGREAGRGR